MFQKYFNLDQISNSACLHDYLSDHLLVLNGNFFVLFNISYLIKTVL